MRQAGLSRTGAWLTALVLGLSPVNGTLINSLWKDIPFSLSVLAVSILLFRAAELKDETSRRGFWVGLGLATVMTVHMRHNGLPVLLGAFMGMFLLEWRRWKLVARAFVLVLIAAMGSRSLLLRAVNVPPVDSGITLIGYLGAHVAAGTELREDERALLNEIRPLDDRWNYLCFSNVPTVFDDRFNMGAVKRHKDTLASLLVELTLRNLQPVVDHAACASSMIWKLSQGRDYLNGPPFQFRPSGGFVTISESPVSPRPEPVLRELGDQMMSLAAKSLEPDVSWIFWRPAVPLYLALLACAVVCLRKRSWRPAAVLMPILMHSAGAGAAHPLPRRALSVPGDPRGPDVPPRLAAAPAKGGAPGTGGGRHRGRGGSLSRFVRGPRAYLSRLQGALPLPRRGNRYLRGPGLPGARGRRA